MGEMEKEEVWIKAEKRKKNNCQTDPRRYHLFKKNMHIVIVVIFILGLPRRHTHSCKDILYHYIVHT
jgi:hypothetical protein